ncbi:MAG: SPASM domain-containing protein [Bacteroidales bacterium]|jgi:uncharacterized protein|nr:SPASM domain-containing protein [Bacteroidales bacterium]
MIWSKYNLLFKSEKYGFLLYNSLSNCFIELKENLYNMLTNIDKSDNNLEKKLPENIVEPLKEHRILVNSDLDEFYNIKYQTLFNRFYDKHLELTINPTLACNFACPYCFEENKTFSTMTDEIENNLIKFIDSYKTINGLSVVWFGGEPLMAFNRIESISKKILEKDIAYEAKMITNGYLLSEKIINSLEKLKINSLQITLDGTEDAHNSRRFLHNGKGTFNKIISNIESILTNSPKTQIIIRVNIDETNAGQFVEIYKYLLNKWKHLKNPNFYIVPGFVEQSNVCSSVSGCLFDRKKKVKFLGELYENYGLNSLGFYPENDKYECPARNPYHLTIGPEGELYKCWNDIGNVEKIVGNINIKGSLNNTLLTRYYTAADPLEDVKCINCFHFPTCGGGCPYLRIEGLYNNVEVDTCCLIKDNAIQFLEWHYDFQRNF